MAAVQSPQADKAQPSAISLDAIDSNNKFALVIGINNYKNGKQLKPLTGAACDARSFRDILLGPLHFLDSNVFIYADRDNCGSPKHADTAYEKASKENQISEEADKEDRTPNLVPLNTAMDRLVEKINRDSVVIVFFSGHGEHGQNKLLKTADDFLLPSDYVTEKSRISIAELLQSIEEKSPRSLLLLIDACRKPTDPVAAKGPRGAGIVFRNGMERPAPNKAVAGALYSCQLGQYSWESTQPPFGFFTHYLITALQGTRAAADRDTNTITFDSLKKWISARVKAHAKDNIGEAQEPDGWLAPYGASMPLLPLPKQTPANINNLIDQAELSLRNGKVDTAIGFAEDAIAQSPGACGRAHRVLMQIYFQRKQYSKVIDHYGEAVKIRFGKDDTVLKLKGLAEEEIEKQGELPNQQNLCRQGSSTEQTRDALQGVLPARATANIANTAFQGEDRPAMPPSVELAERLFRKGRFEDAQVILEKIITANPKDENAWLLAGRIHLFDKDYSKAVEALQQAAALGVAPEKVRGYLSAAQIGQNQYEARRLAQDASLLLLERRLPEAEALIQQALQKDAQDASVYEALGNLRFDQKRDNEAITAFEQALDLEPGLFAVRDRLRISRQERNRAEATRTAEEAALLLNRMDMAGARAKLAEAQGKDANNVLVHTLLGQIYTQEKEPDAAIAEFLEALSSLPDTPDAQAGLRAAVAAKPNVPVDELITKATNSLVENPTIALVLAREAVARDLDNPRSRLIEAEALLRLATTEIPLAQRQKLVADAIREYQLARRLGSVLPGIGEGLQRAELLRRRFTAVTLVNEAYNFLLDDRVLEADVQARDALELDEASADAHAALGYSLLVGKEPNAISHIDQALKLERESGQPSALAHLARGTQFYQEEKWKEAEQELETAVRIAPRMELALNNLGAIYHKRRKWKQAEAQWRMALEVNPNYAYAYANLGILYTEVRKWKEASATYQQAAERNDRNGLFRIHLAEALLKQKLKDQARAAALEALRLGILTHPIYKSLDIRQ